MPLGMPIRSLQKEYSTIGLLLVFPMALLGMLHFNGIIEKGCPSKSLFIVGESVGVMDLFCVPFVEI